MGATLGLPNSSAATKGPFALWKPHVSGFLPAQAPHPYPGASWAKTSAPSPGQPGLVEAGKREKEEEGWGSDHWQAGSTLLCQDAPTPPRSLRKITPRTLVATPGQLRSQDQPLCPPTRSRAAAPFCPWSGWGPKKGEKEDSRQEGWGHREFRGPEASTSEPRAGCPNIPSTLLPLLPSMFGTLDLGCGILHIYDSHIIYYSNWNILRVKRDTRNNHVIMSISQACPGHMKACGHPMHI